MQAPPAAPSLPTIPAPYLARVERLLSRSGRIMLGLAGPPGAGKSTLAMALHHAFAGLSQVVPMDGYHLAQAELQRLGRATRKGAPDTFDSAGYAALLRRIRLRTTGEIIYAPAFHRDIEQPISGEIPVSPDTRLVITEGNYLLLDCDYWREAALQLDEIWYVDVDDQTRTKRLLQRHLHYGRTEAAARNWIHATDAPNAELIAATRVRATLVFDWNGKTVSN